MGTGAVPPSVEAIQDFSGFAVAKPVVITDYIACTKPAGGRGGVV
jgi:hypothetical protein